MVDITSSLDQLVPAAKYVGTLTGNTESDYNALLWEDERPKPTWEEIQVKALEIARTVVLEKLDEWHKESLKKGFVTQFGFKVDCKENDIGNWDATLTMIDLIPFKVRNSTEILVSSYGLALHDAHVIVCAGFYLDKGYEVEVEVNWTTDQFISFILDKYRAEVGDYDNSSPPHYLTITQFKLMCLELGAYYSSQFGKKWSKRSTVLAATSIEELEAISWD
jgi:hypothetical protein